MIAKNFDEHMPEFEIALHTGMRPSEQYGLEWSRVDLKRSFLSLPKTKKGKARHIRLNAVAAFKVLQKRSLTEEGEVFVNIEGKALHGYKPWFDPAVEEAGLRDFTWYCLRHTFASRLAMAGVDLLTISELMGHKTIPMTKRHAHLAPAHNQAAVDRLVGFRPSTEPEPVPAEPSATTSATGPKTAEVAQLAVVH